MNLPFENPYANVERLKRITSDVDENDYYLVKSTRPGLATITGTVGTLWKKLCHELRKRNITDFTHVQEFERFVANCTITLADEPDANATVVSVAELEQLRADSAQWQLHLARSGTENSDEPKPRRARKNSVQMRKDGSSGQTGPIEGDGTNSDDLRKST